jgi:hypothetical protein
LPTPSPSKRARTRRLSAQQSVPEKEQSVATQLQTEKYLVVALERKSCRRKRRIMMAYRYRRSDWNSVQIAQEGGHRCFRLVSHVVIYYHSVSSPIRQLQYAKIRQAMYKFGCPPLKSPTSSPHSITMTPPKRERKAQKCSPCAFLPLNAA